jgi:hypothetical protein
MFNALRVIGLSLLVAVVSPGQSFAQRGENSALRDTQPRSMFGPRTFGPGIQSPRPGMNRWERAVRRPGSARSVAVPEEAPAFRPLDPGVQDFEVPGAARERPARFGRVGERELRQRQPAPERPALQQTEPRQVPDPWVEPPLPQPLRGPVLPGQLPGQPGVPSVPDASPIAEQPPEFVVSDAQVAPLPARPRVERRTDLPGATAQEQQLAQRLQTMLRDRLHPGLQVSVIGEVAVLQGTVDSRESRAIAGHLVSFEPGIRQVRNELVVEPSAAGRP